MLRRKGQPVKDLWNDIVTFGPWALSAVQFAGLAVLFWLRTTFVSSKTFADYAEETDRRVTDAEQSLKRITMKLDQLPRSEDIYNLKLLLKDLEGKQNALVEQNRGIAASLARVENQLAMLFEHHL